MFFFLNKDTIKNNNTYADLYPPFSIKFINAITPYDNNIYFGLAEGFLDITSNFTLEFCYKGINQNFFDWTNIFAIGKHYATPHYSNEYIPAGFNSDDFWEFNIGVYTDNSYASNADYSGIWLSKIKEDYINFFSNNFHKYTMKYNYNKREISIFIDGSKIQTFNRRLNNNHFYFNGCGNTHIVYAYMEYIKFTNLYYDIFINSENIYGVKFK